MMDAIMDGPIISEGSQVRSERGNRLDTIVSCADGALHCPVSAVICR